MGKYVLGVLVLVFVAVLVMKQRQEATVSPRDMLETAVSSMRSSSNGTLSQEEEATARVQVALLDYMAQKGSPPNSLGDLVPTYFDSIPKNPATGKPFEYTRDNKSYRLGGATANTSGRANSGSQPAGAPDASLAMADGADFVNPNTMAPDTFVYDSSGKRDPFKQFDFSARPQRSGASTPLERYSIGQLRLTAVIVDPKTGVSTAFVEDAAGKGYPIKLGAKIGDRGGTVVGIEADRLKILETSIDFTGKEAQRVVEMRIQQQGTAPQRKK